jgi:hypothetical protein
MYFILESTESRNVLFAIYVSVITILTDIYCKHPVVRHEVFMGIHIHVKMVTITNVSERIVPEEEGSKFLQNASNFIL